MATDNLLEKALPVYLQTGEVKALMQPLIDYMEIKLAEIELNRLDVLAKMLYGGYYDLITPYATVADMFAASDTYTKRGTIRGLVSLTNLVDMPVGYELDSYAVASGLDDFISLSRFIDYTLPKYRSIYLVLPEFTPGFSAPGHPVTITYDPIIA